MSRRSAILTTVGLLLIAAALLLPAVIPHHDHAGADFFMGFLLGCGITLEFGAVVLKRRSPS